MQRQRGSVAAAAHVLGVSLVLVQAALAGRTPLPQIAAGRSGTDAPTREALLVWKVGSPHRGDTPVPTAPPDIVETASTLGLSLDVRALPAREFARTFRAARLTNEEPDILVVDNMGLIWGITTPLGRFDGIGADAVVKVSETLKLFAPSPWEFLVPTSRLHAAARTLATGTIQCELPVSVVTGGIRLALVAEGAVAAYVRRDEPALDAWPADRLPPTSCRLPRSSSHSSTRRCATTGETTGSCLRTLPSRSRVERRSVSAGCSSWESSMVDRNSSDWKLDPARRHAGRTGPHTARRWSHEDRGACDTGTCRWRLVSPFSTRATSRSAVDDSTCGGAHAARVAVRQPQLCPSPVVVAQWLRVATSVRDVVTNGAVEGSIRNWPTTPSVAGLGGRSPRQRGAESVAARQLSELARSLQQPLIGQTSTAGANCCPVRKRRLSMTSDKSSSIFRKRPVWIGSPYAVKPEESVGDAYPLFSSSQAQRILLSVHASVATRDQSAYVGKDRSMRRQTPFANRESARR